MDWKKIRLGNIAFTIFTFSVIILTAYFLTSYLINVVNEEDYENNLYEQRLDAMDLVDNLFPVHNQTLVIRNLGYESDLGGSILEFNQSYYGIKYFVYDGWELKRVEYR